MSHHPPYICIEGNIGSGKSILSSLIARKSGRILIHEEFEDNSFLPKFYQNPRQYAFPLEMSFLTARYNQLRRNIPTADLLGASYIADYAFFKNLVFARINLDDDEYNLFMRLFEIIHTQLPRPDLVIFLHQPIPALLNNIKRRARSYEAHIESAYLSHIELGYHEYFKTVKNFPVVMVEAEELDFLKNPAHLDWISQVMEEEHKPGITRLIPPPHL